MSIASCATIRPAKEGDCRVIFDSTEEASDISFACRRSRSRSREHCAGESRGGYANATATAPASMGRTEIVLVDGERIIVGADVDATALARSSRRSRADDSDPEWGARVASDRPHRYA